MNRYLSKYPGHPKSTKSPAFPAAAAVGDAELAEGDAFWLIVTAALVGVVEPPLLLVEAEVGVFLLLPPQAANSAEATGTPTPATAACRRKRRRLRRLCASRSRGPEG